MKIEPTLPDVLQAFVDEQTADGRRFTSAGEYNLALIEEQARQVARGTVDCLLVEGIRSSIAETLTAYSEDIFAFNLRSALPRHVVEGGDTAITSDE